MFNQNPWQPYQPQQYQPQMPYRHPYPAQQPQMEQPYQPQPQPGALNARYVTGREEAVAAQILPDGNLWIFADAAHGRLYTKQVNPQNGLAEFREYMLQTAPEPQQPQQTAPQYATVGDVTALKGEIDQLRSAMAAMLQNRSAEPETAAKAQRKGE